MAENKGAYTANLRAIKQRFAFKRFSSPRPDEEGLYIMMSNVAEGFERSGTGEFLQFLAMAKGSAGEIRAQLYIALDQGYSDKEAFDQLSSQAKETSRMIGSLMNYLKKTKIKGTKYKT